MTKQMDFLSLDDIEAKKSPKDHRMRSSLVSNLSNKQLMENYSTTHPPILCYRQRAIVYRFLQCPDGWVGKAYHIMVSCLILACLLLTVLCTFPEMPDHLNLILYIIDVLILIIFTIELMASFWASTCVVRYRGWRGRIRYIASPFRIIDIAVIVSSIFVISFNIKSGFLTPSLKGVRFFQTFKMIRIENRFRPWRVMASVIWSQREHLYITFYTSFLAVFFTSFLIYYMERDQNPEFENLGESIWWAVISLCTIGYGDIYPITTGGKIVAGICSVVGVTIFALPAGILGTGLALKVQEQQRLRKIGKRRIPAAQLIQSVWRCHRVHKHPPNPTPGVVTICSQSKAVLKASHRRLWTKNETISLMFIMKVKYFVARKRFKQGLKPYDVKDVLEQYSAGHQEMLSKMKQIDGNITRIDSLVKSSLKAQEESKCLINYRLSKIEEFLKGTETRMDRLMEIQFNNRLLYEKVLTLLGKDSQCLPSNEN